MSKKAKILILITIIVIFNILFDLQFFKKTADPSPPQNIIKENASNKQAEPKEAPEILTKKEKLEFTYLKSNEITVYKFMQELKKEGKIDFRDKNYTGMGKFIEEINGIKNEEKGWIYYVNGQKANIGVSNYQINKGDTISWKYEENY